MKNSHAIKIIKITAAVCITSVIITGCSYLDETIEGLGEVLNGDDFSSEPKIGVAAEEDDANTIDVYSENGELLDEEYSVIESAEIEDNAARLPESNLAQISVNAFDGGSSVYCYNKLSLTGQRTYREIYTILDEALSDIILTTKDTEEIDLAFRAVMVDHPEIFYCSGYSIGKYMVDGELVKVSFGGTYTLDKDEIDEKKELLEEYVKQVLISAPSSGDYEKIKYVYEYLVKNLNYDFGAENNQNVLSVVETGRTVCQGYAKMMQLLLSRMDIFCTLVNGRAKSGDSQSYNPHVWNIVRCNGLYYNVDPTWGDSAFNLIDETGDTVPSMEINYEFLLVPDDFLKDSHKQEPVVEMPSCYSLTDNYYVREGFYFEEVDAKRLEEIFQREYAKGSTMLFIKASDKNAYEELTGFLFDEHNVFSYTGQDNVRYVNVESRNLIMISL